MYLKKCHVTEAREGLAEPNINKGYFWKNVHIFVANLFMSNFRNHLIIAAFLPIPLP